MAVSDEAQPILDKLNQLPGAIKTEVAAEVATAEAAKDAQHSEDLQAFRTSVDSAFAAMPSATPALAVDTSADAGVSTATTTETPLS